MRGHVVVVVAAVTTVLGTSFAPTAAATTQAWEPRWQVMETRPGLTGSPQAFALDSAAGRLHVTGTSGRSGVSQVLTYDTTDGALVGVRDGLRDGSSSDIAVDPVSGTYVVTGYRLQSRGDDPPDGSGVQAYDRSGELLWEATIPDLRATAIAVDAERDHVYVTGAGAPPALTRVLAAYQLSTGQLLWTRKPGAGEVGDLAVHAGTGMVVMGGYSDGLTATAYSSTGRRLWESRAASPSPAGSSFEALAVATDGIYVMATGQRLVGAPDDVDTVAYDLDGTVRWIASYDGPVAGRDRGEDVAADPVSGTVVVTGWQEYRTGTGGVDYQDVMVAYDADTGNPRWTRPGPPTSDPPTAVLTNYPVQVDPGRGVVYAATRQGEALNWTTSAYDVRTGQLILADRVDRPVGSAYFTQPVDIAVDERSGQVYVAGEFTTPTTEVTRYVTMSYPPAR